MDPISAGLLLAVAGGMGTGMGEQIWQRLSTLVTRPFRHPPAALTQTGPVGSGGGELEALRQAPNDLRAAEHLAAALATRAALDAEFRAGLEDWTALAWRAYPQGGDVHNEIKGGVFHQVVIQGRDIDNRSFGLPLVPPLASPDQEGGLEPPNEGEG